MAPESVRVASGPPSTLGSEAMSSGDALPAHAPSLASGLGPRFASMKVRHCSTTNVQQYFPLDLEKNYRVATKGYLAGGLGASQLACMRGQYIPMIINHVLSFKV